MNLRKLRKDKAMTLAMVAEILGVSSMQVSRIERGIDNLKVSYAKKLGELYGVEWTKFYESCN